MKRIGAWFLTLILIVSLSACGNGNSGSDVVTSETSQKETQTTATISDSTNEDGGSKKALVAYFSRAGENYGVGVIEKGNTEIVSEIIADEVGADIFRIQTVNAYPESYEECTKVARQERDSGTRPELASAVANFDGYDVIYLGYPIWYGDMPMAVYTFLESYNFTGKTIVPFCTHAGSGLADTVNSIRSVCGGATVLSGLAIVGTTAQNDTDGVRASVNAWIKK